MTSTYDVVVGGGSVAGLSFAAEASSRGLKVLVLEEDPVVGEPEKCDGLVSLKAMREYIPPAERCVQSRVRKGTVFAPSGRAASLDASALEVIVIDRSAYEQQLAESAVSRGAKVLPSSRVVRDGGLRWRCQGWRWYGGIPMFMLRRRHGTIRSTPAQEERPDSCGEV